MHDRRGYLEKKKVFESPRISNPSEKKRETTNFLSKREEVKQIKDGELVGRSIKNVGGGRKG